MMPKGWYLNDSSYYIGIMPDEKQPKGEKSEGIKRYYCCEKDYFEDLVDYEESQNLQPYK